MRWVFILLLLPLVWGAITPIGVSISAKASDGTILVEEVYEFPLSLEGNIEKLASEMGFRYSLWKYEVEDLDTHVCDGKGVKLNILREGNPKIVLRYNCYPEIEREELLWTTYRVDSFRFPLSGGLIVLPEGYTVSFSVEKGTIEYVVPEPFRREENTVMWTGPMRVGEAFKVVYRVPHIYTVPSVTEFLLYRVNSLTVVIILITGVILYIFRRRVREYIVEFIASHSQLVKK